MEVPPIIHFPKDQNLEQFLKVQVFVFDQYTPFSKLDEVVAHFEINRFSNFGLIIWFENLFSKISWNKKKPFHSTRISDRIRRLEGHFLFSKQENGTLSLKDELFVLLQKNLGCQNLRSLSASYNLVEHFNPETFLSGQNLSSTHQNSRFYDHNFQIKDGDFYVKHETFPLKVENFLFDEVLKDYLYHISSGKTSVKTGIIYSCTRYCGGLADRLKGIASVFVLALILHRPFYIDSDNPLPLELFLKPFKIDWTIPSIHEAVLLQLNYNSDSVALGSDLRDWMFQSTGNLPNWISISYNIKDIAFILKNAPPKKRHFARKLLKIPNLFSKIYHTLFQPSPHLSRVVDLACNYLFNSTCYNTNFIGLQVRLGGKFSEKTSFIDPKITEIESLKQFYDCALQVEQKLNLPPSTPWYVTSDSSLVYTNPLTLKLGRKLVWLEHPPNFSHLDGSFQSVPMLDLISSSSFTFVSQEILKMASALVIGRSGFGEVAGEISGARTFYYDGCVELSNAG